MDNFVSKVTPQSSPPRRPRSFPPSSLYESSLPVGTKRRRPRLHGSSHHSIPTLKQQQQQRIRPSSTTMALPSSSSSSQLPPDLWTVRHAPQSSTESVMAPKKVKEIREWMTAHYQQYQHDHRRTVVTTTTTATAAAAAVAPHLTPPPMLILVGRPGIGKSTTVTCLAHELGFETYQWTESMMMNDNNNSSNPIDSFQQFLQVCASDLTPLSTQPRRQKVVAAPPKLILLEELPYTHTSDAQMRLRHVMATHIIRRKAVPTILIVSDTVDGASAPSVLLERGVFDATTLSDPRRVHIMTIHPPTPVKFRHALQRIVDRESRTHQCGRYDTEEFYARCRGDVRYAITTLQWELIGDAQTKTNGGGNRRHGHNTPPVANTTTTASTTMDSKLAPFHALGKLLYAKRRPTTNHHRPITTHPFAQPPLDFCPDAVMQQTDMELPDILYFLSYHSVDFFSDINDLSTALTYFSDVSLLCDTFHGGSSSTTMTLQNVATSMAGRVVAHTNRHPTPSKFRSLSAPKVYDMIRKRRGNQDRIEALSHASWRMDQSQTNAAQLVGRISARTMAMDWLPYRKTMSPHHHVSTVHWDSMFRGGGTAASQGTTMGSLDVEDLEMWKEQEEILKADDIVEDIGDEDGW